MTVQELIDALQRIEDKTLPVCLADWNERYFPPMLCGAVRQAHGKYWTDCLDDCGPVGDHVLLDANDE